MLNQSLAPARLPPGLRIYAVGDIHGCAAQLAALHAAIAEDAQHRPAERVVLLHIGDYVDRGPDSAGILTRLLRPSPVPGAEVVNLLGNHEVMMLEALTPGAVPGALGLWLRNGGEATLASYGATPDPASWGAVPPDHLAFLRNCRLSWRAGGYFFAHAGLRPDRPLDQQDPFDLVWIREPFLSCPSSAWVPKVVVVHGHTPCARPEIRPHRICIDTGAVFGGPLTCAILEENRIGFISA